MLKANENDSFAIQLTKHAAQSLIGSVVATTGMIIGMAIVGAVLDKRKPVFLKPNQKVVTIDENQE